ncbi:hypothetical protein GWK08_16660 [Leptobacterium flavescens]|uniref:DUF4293 family protein n=1 Tax=Leptobacterium flavescens TaxID=472055 RepID=A0A6P0USX6_9FLAO|nr:hypothetical protein [Leptobacterium flavescens]NER15088.1 hypothetical protein [Leptobacterium flavescens]
MIKKAIIITIILNSLILIGVPDGHGYGIMAMFEFISIPYLIKNGFQINSEYPFEIGFIMIAVISLIGKMILIVSLFYKKISDKKPMIYFGLVLIILAFIGVVYSTIQYDSFLFAITFGSGIPFIMYFGRVIYLMNKKNIKVSD